jgi:hypothetical protein
MPITRNESPHIKERLYDLDLSGAYSIGMAHLPTLDFSRVVVTTDLECFLGRCRSEVRFQFPQEAVVMPCLPMKTKRGLVYPLSGVLHRVRAYFSGSGATLQIESGFIIPQDLKQGEPVFKRFVRASARGTRWVPCITVFISPQLALW